MIHTYTVPPVPATKTDPVPAPKTDSAPAKPTEDKPRLMDVLKKLKPLADRWREAGELLDLPKAQLNLVESEAETSAGRLKHMVKIWLDVSPNAAMKDVDDVLEYML